ncbi:hypothetical protein [Nocardioides pakistanensis]
MEPSGTPTPPAPLITLDCLDGTHMGVAVVLWRAALDRDVRTKRLVAEFVPASESLRSAVELLLSLARTAAEANGESDSGVRILRVLAQQTSSAPKARFCHEVADALSRSPRPASLAFGAVPVFSLVDLCTLLSQLIYHRTGVEPNEQIAEWTEHVRLSSLAAA